MNRFLSIDTLRGLIMIIMAIDHAIGNLAEGHPPEIALPGMEFPGYGSLTSQLSRLITHLCAPGFQLLAGMGMALSVYRGRKAGLPEEMITKDLIIRGIVLILVDWFIMGWIYLAPFLFLVLCCIGSCTICFALLRFLPKHLIGLFAVAVIVLAPWYGPHRISEASGAMYHIHLWNSIAISPPLSWFNVMYPVLPWLGIFALGWWIGLTLVEIKDDSTFRMHRGLLIAAGLTMTLLAIYFRGTGNPYFERMPLNGHDITDRRFWEFGKYPPSLCFMMLTVGILICLLGILRFLDKRETAPLWAGIVSVFGRTALFFFVTHFFVFGILGWCLGYVPFGQGEKYLHREGFIFAYSAWAITLVALWPICYKYDHLRQKYRKYLRYC